jgi:hypothetical protein
MTTSVIQIKANQNNAQQSTGPITDAGKQIVANNAIKHGIFSKHLLLNDESPEDYQLLLNGLQTELMPVGTLEQSLVERIAVTLWRQRRLVRSETAHINLANSPSSIVSAVNSELNLTYSEQAITKYDLTEFDQEHYQWCQAVIKEFKEIAEDKLFDMESLQKEAPLMYKQLAEEAEQDEESIEDYLKNWDSPLEFFYDQIKYCEDEVKKAKQRPLVLEIAQAVRNKKAILQGQLRDVLVKYQVMLDNELYKAIKVLRETQAWRLDSLNGFVLENDSDSEK